MRPQAKSKTVKLRIFKNLITMFLLCFFSLNSFANAQPDYCKNPTTEARQNIYRTNVWEGKFLYGGYSTLISSHILGTRHRILINLLNTYPLNETDIVRRLRDFQNDYCSLTTAQTRAIIDYARSNRSNSIFQEERSAIFTDDQNTLFINGMSRNNNLSPVDHLISNGRFTENTFQYNTHRALYNQSYGIPQNSLAAIVNAYVAGIRSIEFDVLETKDNQNVVIHDLTTNRWTGRFDTPPVYVGRHTQTELTHTNIDTLNPLASMPSVESTGVKRMMRTDNVLEFIYRYLPQMTSYADARNDAPVSLLNILKQKPYLTDKVVIKIYPFSLSGGINSVVDKFADRNKITSWEAANEINEINPNILLAMGSAASQANEMVSLGNYSNFNWSIFHSNEILSYLPFSRDSSPENSENNFNGQPVFSNSELIQIEAMTYNLAKWAFDFSAVTNVMVYQVNINPSIRKIIQNRNNAEFTAMPQGDKILSAAIDNFITLYSRVKAGEQPTITLSLNGRHTNLKDAINEVIWGFSDRYPDYTFALNLTSGAVNQATIRDFLYSMEGVAYERNDYSAMKMRSTRAAMDKMRELESQGLHAGYATTDLPTDMRLGAMGLLGTAGLPADLRYRASALIKPRFLPENIPNYQRPIWTSRLYGKAAAGREIQFDADVASIVKYKNAEIPAYENAIMALEISRDNKGVIITNQLALDNLHASEPAYASNVPAAELAHIINILRSDLSAANASLNATLAIFRDTYGVDFIWEREQPYFPVPSN